MIILNNPSFTAADNFNLPLIITDSNGKVLYKNNSALFSMKKIRRSSSILSYLTDKGPDSEKALKAPCFKSIFLDGTIYTNAFVRPFRTADTDLCIWLFSLYFNGTEKPDLLEQELYTELTDCMIDYICTYSSDTPPPCEISTTLRFNNAIHNLFRTLSFTFHSENKFRVHDVVTSVCDITKDVANIYGKTLFFDTTLLDPSNYTNISFEGFANLFTHTLITMFKMSCRPEMEITFSQFFSKFHMSMTITTDLHDHTPESGSGISDLYPLFPDHKLNLLVLDSIISFYDYTVGYSFKERYGRHYLELSFSTDITLKHFVLEEPNETVHSMLLKISKSIYTYKIKELFQGI